MIEALRLLLPVVACLVALALLWILKRDRRFAAGQRDSLLAEQRKAEAAVVELQRKLEAVQQAVARAEARPHSRKLTDIRPNQWSDDFANEDEKLYVAELRKDMRRAGLD